MIRITARGFDLKQGAKDGIESELKRVEKMLPETADFEVTLSKQATGGYQCDVTVRHTGSFIRGEAQADHIEPTVNYAVDDLKRKLRKLKTSLIDKKRKSGIDALATAMGGFDADIEVEELLSADIKRTKQVTLQMMTDEEAIVQMEMLGHSFFVYLGEDGDTRVLYARKHGYGMLICQ